MAKMRVHEFAKELNIKSQEIIDVLSTTEYAVKSHSSSIEDNAQELVRKKLKGSASAKKEPAAESKKESTASKPVENAAKTETADTKTEKPKAEKTKAEKPETDGTKAVAAKAAEGGESVHHKKKSSITAVFNAQYSNQNAGNNNRRPNQSYNGGGNRPQNNGQRRNPSDYKKQTKPAQPVDMRAAFERAINPDAVKAAEEAQKAAAEKALRDANTAAETVVSKETAKPAETAPVAETKEKETPKVRNVYEEMNNGSSTGASTKRPQTERQNVYTNRPNNGTGNRTNGDRPQNVYSNRGNDNRNNTGAGQNRSYGERSNNGQQNGYNRSNSNGQQGGYNRSNNGQQNGYNRSNNNGQQGGYNRTNNGQQGGNGTYSNRSQGDRPNNGQQRPYNDRNTRPDGQRTYQNNRPNNGYSQGNTGNRSNGGYSQGNNNRPNNNYRGKDAASSRDRDAAPATEELRGKETRDRAANRNRNVKRPEHDALGNKRPERIVNLEKNGGKKKPQQPVAPKVEEDVIKTLILPEKMTIRELADKMKVQPSAIVKKLFLKGTMVTVNQEVDYDAAEEIALEFNCVCEPEVKVDVIAELLKEDDEAEAEMVSRPPVVCVMGHVDHGKTSLLDAIRSTRVTDREAGGITQHIGASVVSINNQKITFLDTPGHEAFTAMRMRGANSTDIAILVVAADDGVMPQTIEAINHAKAAGIEIIVAINKIDKPSANIERVKQELSEYELIPEDWGGSTIFCPVSAHTKEGIDNLLEMILLTAEVLELKANPKRNARGLVIEAQLDKGRGAVATVLVQKGTLKVGQPVACGSSYGKVRAMIDDQGRRVKEAGPSTPVEILGLSSVPEAGEIFVSTDSEKEARAFADTYISEGKNKLIEDTKAKMSLDDLFSQIQSGNVKELDVIVKADVMGSVEAVRQSLTKLSNEEVVVKVIHGGVGAINESDVILASASNAIIIGFNVRPDPTAKITAERENVDVRLYKVIYNAIEDVEAAMKGMLDPVFEEKVLGHAEVRQIFKSSGVGNIAGSYVLDGTFVRGCKVRITREGTQIFEGDLASLKRFKDDVKEVKTGFECGLVFDGFSDMQELDIVEAYTMVEVPR